MDFRVSFRTQKIPTFNAHKKFSPYIHARISPIIHAQKIPHNIIPYYYICLNNSFFLSAYLRMSLCVNVPTSLCLMCKRHNVTVAQCVFFCLIKSAFCFCYFSFIISLSAPFISFFLPQPVSIRHVLIQ